jgi:hypothetical protein
MVAISYYDDDEVKAVFVRVLQRENRNDPSNWKQLEKRLKNMLTDAGATLVSFETIYKKPTPPVPVQQSCRGKLVWSHRIPLALMIYVLIIFLVNYFQYIGRTVSIIIF